MLGFERSFDRPDDLAEQGLLERAAVSLLERVEEQPCAEGILATLDTPAPVAAIDPVRRVPGFDHFLMERNTLPGLRHAGSMPHRNSSRQKVAGVGLLMDNRAIAGPHPDLDRVLHGTLLGEGMLNADIAALLADERGFYIAANDEACALTGYSRDQLTQLRAGQLAADERSQAIYEQLVRGRKLQGRKLVRREDGSVVSCRYWGMKTIVTRLPYFLVLIWPTRPAET